MKRLLKIAAIAIGALLLMALAVPFFVDANRFRPLLESKLSDALGRSVKVGNLKLAPFSGGLTAEDVSIAEDPAFGSKPFIQAQRFHIGVDIPAFLFSHRVAVTRISLKQPQIQLRQASSGDWNFSSLGEKSAAQHTSAAPPSTPSAGGSSVDLSVKLVKIEDGRLTIGLTGSRFQPVELQDVNIQLRDFSAASSFPFSAQMSVVGGGTIKLDGTAGPLSGSDAVLTPANLKLHIDQLDLANSRLNEIAPALDGIVSFDGSGQSGAGGIELNGKLKVEKLKLSSGGVPATHPLELDFHIAHDLKKRSGRVHQGDVHFGRALTRLIGTYAPHGDSFALDMTLDGPRMPVDELQGLLPALGVVLPEGTSLQGGTASVKATIEGPVDGLVIAGSVTMNDTRLKGFDLSKRISDVEKLAGIKASPDTEIQQLSGDIRMAPEGVTAENLTLTIPAIGNVTGAGTIDPHNQLNFKMRAAVHTGGVAAALNDAPVPFTVSGTCARPVIRPDVAAVVKDEMKGAGKAAGDLLKGLLGGRKKK